MSKEATTLEQLLSDLETFLKDTVVKSGLPWDSADSQTMDEDTSADRIPNIFHPLAMNSHGLKTQFLDHCAKIQATLQNYSEGKLKDIVQAAQLAGQSGDLDALNTASTLETELRAYVGLLKERAAIQSTVSPLKKAISQCLAVAKEVRCPLDLAGTTRRLMDMAQELRLHFEPLDEETGAMIIAGTIFLLDIHTSSEQTISNVKLSYAVASAGDHDDEADALLTNMLRTGQFQAFQDSLTYLAFLDRHSGFHHMKHVEKDLVSINQIELENNMGSHVIVLNEGHGLPLFHVRQMGLSLIFWADPLLRLERDWSNLEQQRNSRPDQVYRGLVGMEMAPETNFLPETREQSLVHGTINADVGDDEHNIIKGLGCHGIVLKFLNPANPAWAVKSPTAFYFHLHPPIPATVALADHIASLGGLDLNGSIPLHPNTHDTGYQPLEKLIAPEAFASEEGGMNDHDFRVIFDDVNHSYNFMPTEQPPALMIHKVPFRHPSQLFPILQALRRQIVFNSLFRSSFNNHSLNDDFDGDVKDAHFFFVLNSWVPPEKLSFQFMHPQMKDRYRVHFAVDHEAHVAVEWAKFDLTSWVPMEITEEVGLSVNKVANLTLDAPIILRMVCKLLSMDVENNVVIA